MIQNEKGGFGDNATITLNAGASANEELGVHGHYHVECRDKDGNLKWEETAPNLVVAGGKQLMLDTLLRGSAYTVVGPFLGLTKVSLTPAATDTISTTDDYLRAHAAILAKISAGTNALVTPALGTPASGFVHGCCGRLPACRRGFVR